jgi:hydrogenase maturation protease
MGKFVLGMGNVLLRDEGIGCHVVHALEEIPLPDVEIIDGGTCAGIIPPLEATDKLIIVDAVKGGGMPGQIYRFHLEDIALEPKPFLSLHDMSLVDDLMSMQPWHNISEAVIIGIEPREIDWGLGLSPELQAEMPQIIDVILAELNNTNPKGEKKC